MNHGVHRDTLQRGLDVLSSPSNPPHAGSPQVWKRAMDRLKKALFVGTLTVGAMLAMPTEAHAGIFGVFDAIFGLIKGPIGSALSDINAVTKDTQQLYQSTMWPLALINQARGFVSNSITSYRGYMTSVFFAPFNSATLTNPKQLETVLHSRDVSQLGNLTSSFHTNFGMVPVANTAAPQDRVMMDIDDTLGQENLKTTIISDQAQDSILATADELENQVAVSTPGSTPFLTAQAQLANLRSQAYMQKMLAAELRQEAGLIAHQNTLMKRRAQDSGDIGNQIKTALSR
jgi:hypothetical protein